MKQLQKAKLLYQKITPPAGLDQRLRAAMAQGQGAAVHAKKQIRWHRPFIYAATACCLLFVVLLNSSRAFAESMYNIPVVGQVARVFTFRQYEQADESSYVQVQLPALSNTGNGELEQRINQEISAKIDAIVQQEKAYAKENRQAYLDTGGDPAQYIPTKITIDYEVKHSQGDILSFVINESVSAAHARQEQFFYNIHLPSGREITLQDMLGENYKQIVDSSVRQQMAQREASGEAEYFSPEDPLMKDAAFQGIDSSQPFYIDAGGNVVVVFPKYSIGPGYIGIQEFTITTENNGQAE